MSDVISINKNKSQYEKIKDIIGKDIDFVLMMDDEDKGMSVMSNVSDSRKLSYFVAFLGAVNIEEIVSRLDFGGEE